MTTNRTAAPGAQSIERRVQRLEDEAAIQRLVQIYARLCDAAYDPDGIAELFTEDAVWSAASGDGDVDFGRHEGREEIRRFFAGASKTIGPMTLHYVSNPLIEVSEDRLTAKGHWYSLTFMERPVDGSDVREAGMLGSRYYHDYRNVGGTWLFAKLDCVFSFDRPLVAGRPRT